MNGLDDLVGVDALQLDRGHAEVAGPELALADVQWHPLAQQFERVRVPWSPDSRWIAYDQPSGTIRAVTPRGARRRTLLAATDHMTVHKPVFSPDGRSLLFMCAFHGPGGDDDLCTINLEGTGLRDLTDTPLRGENGPSWGPAPH